MWNRFRKAYKSLKSALRIDHARDGRLRMPRAPVRGGFTGSMRSTSARLFETSSQNLSQTRSPSQNQSLSPSEDQSNTLSEILDSIPFRYYNESKVYQFKNISALPPGSILITTDASYSEAHQAWFISCCIWKSGDSDFFRSKVIVRRLEDMGMGKLDSEGMPIFIPDPSTTLEGEMCAHEVGGKYFVGDVMPELNPEEYQMVWIQTDNRQVALQAWNCLNRKPYLEEAKELFEREGIEQYHHNPVYNDKILRMRATLESTQIKRADATHMIRKHNKVADYIGKWAPNNMSLMENDELIIDDAVLAMMKKDKQFDDILREFQDKPPIKKKGRRH